MSLLEANSYEAILNEGYTVRSLLEDAAALAPVGGEEELLDENDGPASGIVDSAPENAEDVGETAVAEAAEDARDSPLLENFEDAEDGVHGPADGLIDDSSHGSDYDPSKNLDQDSDHESDSSSDSSNDAAYGSRDERHAAEIRAKAAAEAAAQIPNASSSKPSKRGVAVRKTVSRKAPRKTSIKAPLVSKARRHRATNPAVRPGVVAPLSSTERYGRKLKTQRQLQIAAWEAKVAKWDKNRTEFNADPDNVGETFTVKKPELPKARREAPGIRALKEIRHYQKQVTLSFPKVAFRRLCNEIACDLTSEQFRWQQSALDALQEASESVLVGFFENCVLASVHAKRVTVRNDDMALIRSIMRNVGVGIFESSSKASAS